MEVPRWAVPAAAVLTASAMVLTACGKEIAATQKNAGAGSRQTPAADPPEPSRAAPPAIRPASLEAARVDRLGTVVTDGEGRTLYRFDEDTSDPPASKCEGPCAETWPPVMTGPGEVRVQGVDRKLVGKVRRPDGRWQVTLGGWPMYRYAQDRSRGEAGGQGVGGTWYAAAPDGTKARASRPDRGDGPEQGDGREQGGRWAGWTIVKVKRDPQLGAILTDGKGRVMYRFDRDRAKRTNCSGACKKAWPPVLFTNWKKLRVEGVDRELVDFIEREDDGTCQLTIDGRPMYYYADDARPGDTAGQGVQGVWWVVSQQGRRVTSQVGGGYGGY